MKLALKPENIAQLVFFMRGEKVMFDADLAKLYGVTTKALNQAVSRNQARFPGRFRFPLNACRVRQLEVTICDLIRRGTTKLEVTNCDLKFARRPPTSSDRLHRARRCDAFKPAAKRTCGRGQHRNHVHVRAVAPAYGYESRSRSQNRSP